jgi:hypothetical protein
MTPFELRDKKYVTPSGLQVTSDMLMKYPHEIRGDTGWIDLPIELLNHKAESKAHTIEDPLILSWSSFSSAYHVNKPEQGTQSLVSIDYARELKQQIEKANQVQDSAANKITKWASNMGLSVSTGDLGEIINLLRQQKQQPDV